MNFSYTTFDNNSGFDEEENKIVASGNRTNNAGIPFFRSKGLTVSDDGVIENGLNPFRTKAKAVLKADQTEEQQKRSTIAMQSWAASLGITMSASYDDPAIAKKVSDDGNAIMRVRSEIHGGGWNGDIFTLPVVSVEEIEVSITEAKAYADNDMYRPYAIGEFLDLNPSSFGATTIEQVVDEETFMPKIELAARMGVVVHIHTLSQIETQAYLQAFEALDGDISDLRWQLAHLPSMTTESMDRLHALGGGGVTATFSYNSFESAPPPPFKELYEHEIHSGIGSDGGNVGTINP